jgi:hypothetical protein
VLSDNTTVAALITTIGANCSSHLTSNTSSSPTPFNASTVDGSEPEQAVEYYRASSVVLTLDGYNNTEALTGKENFTNAPLPSGIDTSLLDCLNQTIGFSVPLIDAATTRWATPGMGIIETISVFWIVFFLLFT